MWVLVALASLAVLIVLVFCVPLYMVFRVEVYGRPRLRMKLAWFFGRVSKEIRKGEKEPEKKREAVVRGKKKRWMRISARTIFEILRIKGLLGRFRDLIIDVIRLFRVRNLGADITVGLDDPGDTGLIFALVGPVAFFLNAFPPCQIKVQPSFAGEATFEGYLYGKVRLQPIQLVAPSLRFVFSLATLKVIKLLVLRKWKKRK